MFGQGRHHQRPGGRPVAELTGAVREAAVDGALGMPAGARAVGAGVTGSDAADWHDEAWSGPFDEADAPDDGDSLLDLGSVRLPMPDGAQLQVEVDPTGAVRAVHLLTELGQLTVSAFAAPRSGNLWDEVHAEILSQLRLDGADVDGVAGEWGGEVHALTAQVTLRFVGVDGPRWLLRGVAAGPAATHDALVELLYEVLRGTVVVRGAEALPVRSPLPLTLPGPMAEQLKDVAAARQEQQPLAGD